MKIDLPKKLNSPQSISIDSKSIVIIGANGSGKTRFGRDIEERYDEQTHRISAQKSLSMPKEVRHNRGQIFNLGHNRGQIFNLDKCLTISIMSCIYKRWHGN